mgnify:CR=1 FL=1
MIEGGRARRARLARRAGGRGQGRCGARREIGFPVILKASAGGGGPRDADRARGGGRSRRRSAPPRPRPPARLRRARRLHREATWTSPAHIEIQVMADTQGTASSTSASASARSSAATRRSSRRRRRPLVTEKLRAADGTHGGGGGQRPCSTSNAGTVEFLLDTGRQLLLHGDEHAHPGRARRAPSS